MNRLEFIDFKRKIINYLAPCFTKNECALYSSYLAEFYLGKIAQPYSIIEFETVDLNLKINDLINNKPIQQVVGFAYFNNEKFVVNEHSLIPRPETEGILKLVNSQKKEYKNILDIGTGSGCIAIELQKNYKKATLTAIDISTNALKIAAYNNSLHATNVDFIEFDILKFHTTNMNIAFDCIVSNPPYILIDEIYSLEPRVRDFEPHLALFCESNPMLFYDAICSFSLINLAVGGLLIFETHTEHASEVANLLINTNFKNVEIKKDCFDLPRFVQGFMP